MGWATLAPPAAVSASSGNTAQRSTTSALVVFIAALVGAFLLYAIVGHRHYWFWHDKWDFLVARDGADLHDLLRPHNEHWSTVPILFYRLVWRVFGLKSYAPCKKPRSSSCT